MLTFISLQTDWSSALPPLTENELFRMRIYNSAHVEDDTFHSSGRNIFRLFHVRLALNNGRSPG